MDPAATPDGPGGTTPETHPPSPSWRRRVRRAAIVGGIVVGVVIVGLGAMTFIQSRPSIDPGGSALAQVDLPPGATLLSISATNAHGDDVALIRHGTSVIPAHPTAPGTVINVTAVVRNSDPGRWVLGSTSDINAQITTPEATISTPPVQTLPAGSTVLVSFDQPVARAAITPTDARATSVHSASGVSSIAIPDAGSYGTAQIATAPRSWETLSSAQEIAWFAPAARTQVLGSPSQSSLITPYSQISLTYSRPVVDVRGALHPTISAHVAGTWRQVNTYTVTFTPRGSGFAPDSVVSVILPVGTSVAGAPTRVLSWTVAEPSPVRAEQILAQLGYLPLTFAPSTPVAQTQQAQVEAMFAPPSGAFAWRYASTPAALRSTWSTDPEVVLQGAIMAFENAHNMTTDGLLGPQVWTALVQSELADQRNTFGYTFVNVSQQLPETLTLWHNGTVVMTPLVNTGIAAAPTAPGVYPVYLREVVGTMTGKNPNGTTYHDPGIPWISYFHGGDALHGFIRSSYGFPQSLGCVEMPFAVAGQVWPYTPIGTLVDIEPDA